MFPPHRLYIFLQSWLLVSMQTTWNGNVLNNEKSSCRFPCAVVWQPFPPLTWFIPMIGHTGITDSHGIVHDFQGVSCSIHTSHKHTQTFSFCFTFCVCVESVSEIPEHACSRASTHTLLCTKIHTLQGLSLSLRTA